MHQYFYALRRGNGDGMPGRVQLGNPAIAGRAQALIQWIDGNAITDHFLGEYRVRHPFKRYQHTREWCGKRDPGGIMIEVIWTIHICARYLIEMKNQAAYMSRNGIWS
jgi:hypothetical protein